MRYPIFNSFINRIKADLTKKNISPDEFITWNDDTLNATGLELTIDVSDLSLYVQSVTINFDWDKFREVSLARQLPGMEKHPLLSVDNPAQKTTLTPNMDVEVTWTLKEDAILDGVELSGTEWRVEVASRWMEEINRMINETMPSDYIISRWHIEIDGDSSGRYLSAMSLISYFQFTLTQMSDLTEILDFISRKLQVILLRSNRILQIVENAARSIAA